MRRWPAAGQIDRDDGFTLVEILVVVIILGILSAISYPMLLTNRRHGWDAALQIDVRRAALAVESAPTAQGTYPTTLPAVTVSSESTQLVYSSAPNGLSFCIRGTRTELGAERWWLWTSQPGRLIQNGECPL